MYVYYGPGEEFYIMGAVFCMLIMIVCLVLCSVFLGLCVYYDAKSKMNPSATVYGVLCGLFGLIPLIVYLAVRNQSDSSIECPQCKARVFRYMPRCPVCNLDIGSLQYYPSPFIQGYKNKRKVFLILTIVTLVLSIALFIGAIVLAAGSVSAYSYPGGDSFYYY